MLQTAKKCDCDYYETIRLNCRPLWIEYTFGVIASVCLTAANGNFLKSTEFYLQI